MLFRSENVAGKTFSSHEHTGLVEIVSQFVGPSGLRADHACFGVAGAVINGRCKATNLPWTVDSSELARLLGLNSVGLINDLEANANGIAALQPHDFAVLNAGRPNLKGNQAVISAGTGLGEAGLFWDGSQHRPFACEGGHAGFTPRNEVEMALLRHLYSKMAYVDAEHTLSGPGLHNIYLFLKETRRGKEAKWLAEEMKHHDPSACISQAALEGKDPMSVQALDIFVSIYGTEAANLALKVMATGGVFLGGGIAPKILNKLRDGRFLEAFLGNGSMKYLLEVIPVRVILNEKTALLGAARAAASQPAVQATQP